MGAAHIALTAHKADALDPVQGLVQGAAHPAGPVGGEQLAANGVRMETVVYQYHAGGVFPVEAQDMHPLVKFADGMVDVGVVDGRAGHGGAVFHLVKADIGHPLRGIAGDEAHFGGL